MEDGCEERIVKADTAVQFKIALSTQYIGVGRGGQAAKAEKPSDSTRNDSHESFETDVENK